MAIENDPLLPSGAANTLPDAVVVGPAFAALLQAMPDGIVVVDSSGVIVLANSHAERLFGYAADELHGHPIEVLVPLRMRDTHVQHRTKMFAQPRLRAWASAVQLCGMHKDGTDFPVEISLSPIETDRGSLVISAVRDVSERKRDEAILLEKNLQLQAATESQGQFEELQRHAGELQVEMVERARMSDALIESETRFRQVVENLHEVVFLLDPVSNRTLYVSPAYETIWKASRESLYADSLSWSNAIHPDDREGAAQSWASTLATGLIANDYRIVRPDGSVRWISARGFPIRDATGQVHRIAGIAEDVTERRQAQDAMADSEARYRQLFKANPLPMWVYDFETLAFLAVNDAAVDHYGYTREQFLAMTILDIRPEQDQASVREHVRAQAEGIQRSGVWHHRKRDGSIIQVEISSHALHFYGRRAQLVLAHDVTERSAQDRKIARLSRIRAVIGGISSAMVRLDDRDALLQEACRVAVADGVFPMAVVTLIDPRTGLLTVSAAHAEDRVKMEQAQRAIVGLPLAQRPAHRAAVSKQPLVINDLALEPGMVPVGAELARMGFAAGASFPLKTEIGVVGVLTLLAREPGFFDEDEIALLEWLAGDLSFALDHIEQSKRLQYLSYHDPVTGLPNARHFQDRLDQFVDSARESGGQVCLVVIDLEHFTQVNDTLGRAVGDELLRKVGARLESAMTEPFALGRIGADTFVAASPGGSGSIATALRDRTFAALEGTFDIDGHAVAVTAQAGIALFPADGDDGATVFKNAEASLKLAKAAGERYAYHSREISDRLAERLALERQLRAAIETGQLVLHFQARADIISGLLIGAEALIRWQHPDRGLLGPASFIGLAEEAGLIVRIGAWVIETVCAQQAAWARSGVVIVPIAVNVSSVQFAQSDLLAVVQEALVKHGLDPSKLDLELTESSVMTDSAGVAETLRALGKLGVGLSLDDFGTGYSSLSHLKRYPFNSVKIDRSFITDITSSTDDAAISGAIIAMAHRLDLKVVAEGVETQGQLNYLSSLGCDQMQGHLFSHAVPAAELEAQLRTGKRLGLRAITPDDQRTVLIVDDEPGIRTALIRVLRRDGYRLLTAASGAEGLALLSTNPVKVIISDQRMPNMTGTQFLGTVRHLYPDTVRILLSGYADVQVVTDAINLGSVFKFLTKPWDDNVLREQVRDAFRRFHPEPASAA